MKILTRLPVLALIYLVVPVFALAQIAPSGIFREQPTPTPAPQPSPPPTPAAATTTSNEPPPAAAKPERRTAKATKPPAKTPAKTPRTQPVADDKRPSDTAAAETIVKLRQMEGEWLASPHNTATIQRVVADDFIGVTSEGEIVTKKAMLKGSNEGKSEGSSSVGRMDVRLHGAKVAVVVGTARQSKSPAAFYRFTDTWIERDGNWQCIASQVKTLTKLKGGNEEASASFPEWQTGSHLPRRHY